MVQNLTCPSSSANANNTLGFNPTRLIFARNRRGLKKTELAKKIGVTARSIAGYESGAFPPDLDKVDAISSLLKFPKAFFYSDETIELLDSQAVSFRAITKMSATLKNIALGSGAIAVLLNGWVESKFRLPEPDLPELGRDIDPETAAEALRKYWNLGMLPINNMVHLLEAKGVRVFSLSIDTQEIDAFSMWQDGTPYAFLNTLKSAERSRFDAAHELGHLVMHRHGQPHGLEAEKEADAFASAFLMPAKSILATRLEFPTLDSLIKLKKHWAVSVAALNYRLRFLGMTSEWINRSLCIQIAQAGFRSAEPQSIARETSQILEKVFAALRLEGVSKSDVARQLQLSTYEIDELTYGLLKIGSVPDHSNSKASISQKRMRPNLSIVK